MVERGLYPVMEYLVPRAKLGIFARMAERIVADNPNMDELELRKQLARAADATEDRLGQVTYDNLFQHRVIKDIGQLGLRAYGWQLTKYRMMFGGLSDWVKLAKATATGGEKELTFRMTYVPAMIMGHAVIGATIHYLLTGKHPKELKDYLFPQTGMTDAYGQPVRISIADFVKDVAADFHAFPSGTKMAQEWTRKLGPGWNMAVELMRNEDFYGQEIFSTRDVGEPWQEHVLANLKEGTEYFSKNMGPFSVKAGARLRENAQTELGKAAASVGPWFGFVPAPRYATSTPAETLASDIMKEQLPKRARTKEQMEHSRAVSELVRNVRTGKVADDASFYEAARAAGVKDNAEVTRISKRVLYSPLQNAVAAMPLDHAMRVWDLASDKEKLGMAVIIAQRIQRKWDAGELEPEKASRYVQMTTPYYQRVRLNLR